jgi:hypothetical protein
MPGERSNDSHGSSFIDHEGTPTALGAERFSCGSSSLASSLIDQEGTPTFGSIVSGFGDSPSPSSGVDKIDHVGVPTLSTSRRAGVGVRSVATRGTASGFGVARPVGGYDLPSRDGFGGLRGLNVSWNASADCAEAPTHRNKAFSTGTQSFFIHSCNRERSVRGLSRTSETASVTEGGGETGGVKGSPKGGGSVSCSCWRESSMGGASGS